MPRRVLTSCVKILTAHKVPLPPWRAFAKFSFCQSQKHHGIRCSEVGSSICPDQRGFGASRLQSVPSRDRPVHFVGLNHLSMVAAFGGNMTAPIHNLLSGRPPCKAYVRKSARRAASVIDFCLKQSALSLQYSRQFVTLAIVSISCMLHYPEAVLQTCFAGFKLHPVYTACLV